MMHIHEYDARARCIISKLHDPIVIKFSSSSSSSTAQHTLHDSHTFCVSAYWRRYTFCTNTAIRSYIYSTCIYIQSKERTQDVAVVVLIHPICAELLVLQQWKSRALLYFTRRTCESNSESELTRNSRATCSFRWVRSLGYCQYIRLRNSTWMLNIAE